MAMTLGANTVLVIKAVLYFYQPHLEHEVFRRHRNFPVNIF